MGSGARIPVLALPSCAIFKKRVLYTDTRLSLCPRQDMGSRDSEAMWFPQTWLTRASILRGQFWTANETVAESELLARLLVAAGQEHRNRLPSAMELMLRMANWMVSWGVDMARSYGPAVGGKKLVAFWSGTNRRRERGLGTSGQN